MHPSGLKSAGCAAGALVAALLMLALGAVAPAQAQGVTDALSGFSTDSDEPVHIEADELEVRDRDHVAVFTGNVVVHQGGTTLRTAILEVHYTTAPGSADGEAPGGGSLSRLEARGGVIVETEDQKATGDWAEFEMETQEVTLGGDVVLTQGDNVIRGARLVVDLESGRSRLYASAPGEGEGRRVQGLFIPGTMRQGQE